jgi:UDP-N-acetylglucosamine 1-carboxyvinyltransferase
MIQKFIIKGGKPLNGSIDVRGSKNAATPIIAATLLTKKPCIISNIPLIEDVFRMIELIKSLGAKIDWLSENEIKIEAKNIDPKKLDKSLISKMRSSILILGPILARCGFVEITHPGGCIIGTRSIETHLKAFESIASVNVSQTNSNLDKNSGKYSEKNKVYSLKLNKKIKSREIVLDEFSVTATENILMACSLLPEKKIIKIAACEPHVQDLIIFLQKMGVNINGGGNHTINILGKKNLSGANHSICYDYIEAGTYILMTLTVGGRVQVNNVPINHLDLFFKKIISAGANIKIVSKNSVIVEKSNNMKIDKIQTSPYPGIPTDLQSCFGVMATQTIGMTLIQDPLYDGRLKYLEELNKMGAEIVFCDPHRAVVNGPTNLYGAELGTFDLRGGVALIIAGLAAKGITIINNISQVDRGYEKIEERLQKIGADIKRINIEKILL